MPKKKTRNSKYIAINGSFLQIPHKTIISREFNSLSYASMHVYMILLTKWSREKDKANKEYSFTYSEIAENMIDENNKKPSSQTISNALKKLEKKEFISITYGGKNNPNKIRINTKWLQ